MKQKCCKINILNNETGTLLATSLKSNGTVSHLCLEKHSADDKN